MKNKKILFNIILFLLLTIQRGYMSQAGFIDVTVDELIKSSDAVLLVTKNDPFETIKKIKFLSLPWKKCPPYDKYIHNYTVNEIISNTKNISFDKNIKVIDAYFESNLSIYKKMCKENIGIFIVYKTYKTSINIKNENRFIIFIKKTDNNYEFKYTVKSAYESENYLFKIKKILSIKNRYLQLGNNVNKALIIKAADKSTTIKYNTFGINDFKTNKKNKFLFQIIIPHNSNIKKISIQTENNIYPLPEPVYIYKMKTSPKATYFLTGKNKYKKLNFIDNNENVIYSMNLIQYEDILFSLPLRIININGYISTDYDGLPYQTSD